MLTEAEVVEMLREAVDKAGSQTAFCRESGLSTTYVSEILAGKMQPGEKLARALGITMRRNFYRSAEVING